jgi:hypothetical protein
MHWKRHKAYFNIWVLVPGGMWYMLVLILGYSFIDSIVSARINISTTQVILVIPPGTGYIPLFATTSGIIISKSTKLLLPWIFTLLLVIQIKGQQTTICL